MAMKEPDFYVVNIEDITDDEFFKVSKKNYQNTLPASLKLSGMLEIPYIIKTDSGCDMLTCHNRIKILKESGISQLKCFALDKPDLEIFVNHVSIKAYRNELGPVGKLKTISILNSFFNVEESLKKRICTKILKLPLEISENEVYVKKILDFPENLLTYLDEKDISFKVIKDLSLLPCEWIAVIDNWINNIQVRVNIFRMLIDNIFDIYRRGDDLSVIESIPFSDDKILYDSVFRIRNPEFFRLKNKADGIINELSGAGLTIEFPEYFDRSFITLKLDIDKKSDCHDQLDRILKISVEKLKDLLSYL